VNRYGAASRFAFDPKAVVEFIDWYVPSHGFVLSESDKRQVRRWRSVTRGATYRAVADLLLRYNCTVQQMERWAKLHRRRLVLRGKEDRTTWDRT
jgi:flavorubredoxin